MNIIHGQRYEFLRKYETKKHAFAVYFVATDTVSHVRQVSRESRSLLQGRLDMKLRLTVSLFFD
jgi:hypothetical protein